MHLEWQIARVSPWGIVDFSQEGCLLLEMWFRLAWHFPVPLWCFLPDRNLLLASPIIFFRPITPQQVKRNNRRIDYMWTTEQHSENVFTVVSLSSKCQESALHRRSSARWMINESECFHNWPHKQISTQVNQQRASPLAAERETQELMFLELDSQVKWCRFQIWYMKYEGSYLLKYIQGVACLTLICCSYSDSYKKL